MIRNEKRILREGIRFFLNIITFKCSKKIIYEHLCWLALCGLYQLKDEDTLNLCLFCLNIMSENIRAHNRLINHKRLLKNLSTIPKDKI